MVLFFAVSPVLAGVPESGILKDVKCAATGGGDYSGVGPNSSVYTPSYPCGLCDFIQIFVNASNLIVSLSGALAILMFVYAGIMYLTVSFKPENATKAKSAAQATIIGLAFIFGGYTIMNFVILTFVGGTPGMNALSRISGNPSGGAGWGVCTGYETNTSGGVLKLQTTDQGYYGNTPTPSAPSDSLHLNITP